eukprot:10995515-Lingulodinium_polyedra.AAC.1
MQAIWTRLCRRTQPAPRGDGVRLAACCEHRRGSRTSAGVQSPAPAIRRSLLLLPASGPARLRI